MKNFQEKIWILKLLQFQSPQNSEKKIKEVSKTDSNIVLIGDEGSGKEFVASKIHDYSHRSKNISNQ